MRLHSSACCLMQCLWHLRESCHCLIPLRRCRQAAPDLLLLTAAVGTSETLLRMRRLRHSTSAWQSSSAGLLRWLLLLCRAADWLAEQPAIEIGTRCNLFEANIRVMGGLIR